jgi:hypothetical protein
MRVRSIRNIEERQGASVECERDDTELVKSAPPSVVALTEAHFHGDRRFRTIRTTPCHGATGHVSTDDVDVCSLSPMGRGPRRPRFLFAVPTGPPSPYAVAVNWRLACPAESSGAGFLVRF